MLVCCSLLLHLYTYIPMSSEFQWSPNESEFSKTQSKDKESVLYLKVINMLSAKPVLSSFPFQSPVTDMSLNVLSWVPDTSERPHFPFEPELATQKEGNGIPRNMYHFLLMLIPRSSQQLIL